MSSSEANQHGARLTFYIIGSIIAAIGPGPPSPGGPPNGNWPWVLEVATTTARTIINEEQR